MEKFTSIGSYLSLLGQHQLLVGTSLPEEMLKTPVKGLTFDDREVTDGTLFVCKGAHFKPDYLLSAGQKGAFCYVSEKSYPESPLPYLLVPDIRRAMALLADLYFDHAPSHLTTVGITGTKGKSTIAFYLKQILDKAFEKECAILSSIDNFDGAERVESHLTTPEAIVLHRHCRTALDHGLSHLVMEVSSQALKYDRVYAFPFDIVCFHNIGTDHLSPIEHPDFEDYFSSKLKIFGPAKTACLNSSSDHFDRILSAAKEAGCHIVTYGFRKEDDIFCRSVKTTAEGATFSVRFPGGERQFTLTMPGRFNVDNALAAIAMALSLSVSPDVIAEGLREARAAGRMEVFKNKDASTVAIVDYAHNQMSFEALFSSAAADYPGRKIISVYGCPGGKAFLRRKDLAEVAGKYADLVIVTEEDSGEEPFESISSDIAEHLKKTGVRFIIEPDRGQAIRRAIFEGREDKVILITGKGRETREKRGTLYVDTPSDVDYVECFFKEYDASLLLV